MVNYADCVVFDKQGQPVLLVEIKNILGTLREWAAMLVSVKLVPVRCQTVQKTNEGVGCGFVEAL